MSPPYEDAIEVIPNVLYWVAVNSVPKSNRKILYFSIDEELIYEPFFADFGPLNLGSVHKYCKLLQDKLNDPANAGRVVVHCCSHNPHKRPNAAFLVCAFQVVVNKKTAEQAFKPFSSLYPPFLPFRDATYGICTHHLTVQDCLKGLECAIKIGWFDLDKFDVDSYLHYEKVENGDLNWIVPNKFLAFSGPLATPTDEEGYAAFTPEAYVKIFKKLGVKLVVRLNKKQYDRTRFTAHGIQHEDLYFLDGSCPSRDLIRKFLQICESHDGAVAVHCKAGLGRTGTLIGCYAIKNFGFRAAQWIGWNRICRPGSVLGPQQHFLREVEKELSEGTLYRSVKPLPPGEAELTGQLKAMSLEERRAATFGDQGQGERLVQARRHQKGRDSDKPSGEESSAAGTSDESNTGNARPGIMVPKSKDVAGSIKKTTAGINGKGGSKEDTEAKTLEGMMTKLNRNSDTSTTGDSPEAAAVPVKSKRVSTGVSSRYSDTTVAPRRDREN